MDSFTMEFNKLLNDELNKKENDHKENICLISKEPLEKIHIKLSCNHVFNYESIFNEVVKQKLKKNYKETQKLSRYEIKCPYCRNVENKLLPHNPSFDKIKLVNWPPDKSMESPYLKEKCEYIFKSGKKKGNYCGKACNEKYCKSHFAYIKRREAIKKKKEKFKNKKITTPANEIIAHTFEINTNNENVNTIETPKLAYACPNGIYTLFNAKCNHIFSRGKNKGKPCSATYAVTDLPGGIKLHRNKWLCPKCRKLKKYKNFVIEYNNNDVIVSNNSKYGPTYVDIPDNNVVKFLEKNYKYYMNVDSPYMVKSKKIKDGVYQIKFIKI